MDNEFQTINPANGQRIADYRYMSDDELSRAIENCHIAFTNWRARAPEERARVIGDIGSALTENKEELASLMTREMGKLLAHSRQEVDLCASICAWTAANGPDELSGDVRELDQGTGHIVHAPIGVIYGIQPWNYPAYQVVRYTIANLMAGNGVLLKHADNVTGSGERLADIYRSAGLPENLFTVLRASHAQSDDIIENRRVRGVTLTGSPEAGRTVGAKAASVLKKSVLELGSNDAYIILADADIEKAVSACVKGRVYNNGETCIAAKRFVVVDDIYESFRDAFVQAMRDLKTGDPSDPDIDLGPIAREDLRDKLHQQVEKSAALGAVILCGGSVPDGAGYFYPATVLENVSPGQPAYDEELFGPVAALIRAVDADDAMRIANDSRFGLGGGIMTKDTDKALQLASQHFDTGMVFINRFGLADPALPFGGVKESGYGREHGGYGIREFTNTKAIVVAA